MSGSKAPDFDAYGLLRAPHSHNPTQYSHIVGLSSHFYAHIGSGSQGLSPTYERAHVGERPFDPGIILFYHRRKTGSTICSNACLKRKYVKKQTIIMIKTIKNVGNNL